MLSRNVSRCVLIAVAGALSVWAQAQEETGQEAPGRVGPDGFATIEPMASIKPAREAAPPAEWRPGDPIRDVPRRATRRVQEAPQGEDTGLQADPLVALQEQFGEAREGDAFGAPLGTFGGIGFTGSIPPDTTGDVGPNHYVQATNGADGTAVAIFNKAGSVLAFFTLDDLMPPGIACKFGQGDPVVVYDQYADRWLLTEFADRAAGNALCIYVSQTPDPLGMYWLYQINTPEFPDYPKYGVFPEAYYIGTNESTSRAYALDRPALLAGAPARHIWFDVGDLSGFAFQALEPADGDGIVPPPPGTPGVFARHLDSEYHSVSPAPPAGKDYLQLFLMKPDFVTPANSTLTGPLNVNVTDFSSNLCGSGGSGCIPQPGTTARLDPLREVVMHRLQYRNFRRYQTLVGSFAHDADFSSVTDRTALRWFELRNTGTGWSLHQEGTWTPDATHRWMSSTAMDGAGNIATGYSVSSSVLSPGIRYAGRTAGAALGTFNQAEATLYPGTGYFEGSRWGDYAGLTVDPADDCTFWMTTEHAANGFWATRVGAFRFDVCVPFVKGDLNQDRKPDLVLRNDAGAHEVWAMNGTVRVATLALSPNPAASQLVSGVDDFNADNRNDLVLWNAGTGAVEFWLMNGVTRVGSPVPLTGATGLPSPWKLSATADFNRDGKPDLVWRNFTTQKIVIWTLNGTAKSGEIVPAPDQAVDANWEVVAALDYNGDGYVDFMWYNRTSGKIVCWFMNASVQRTTGSFTSPPNAGDNNWKVLASADYGIGPDGADAAAPVPGSHDLIWRNGTSGRFVVWHLDYARNRTAGLFTTPSEPSSPATSWTIVGPR